MTSTLPRPAGRTRGGALRFWLGADAVITGANAVVYLAAAPLVVDLLGTSTGAVRTIGAFLLIFAGYVALAAVRAPERGATRAVVAVNLGWSVASIVAVAVDALDLTAVGATWAIAQALVVGGLAVQQYRSLP